MLTSVGLAVQWLEIDWMTESYVHGTAKAELAIAYLRCHAEHGLRCERRDHRLALAENAEREAAAYGD